MILVSLFVLLVVLLAFSSSSFLLFLLPADFLPSDVLGYETKK